MRAHGRAVGRHDRARHARQVAREEIAKRPLADEADAGRIALGVRRNAFALGDRAHVALRHLAQRKQRRRKLRLRQPVQEIRLVLRRVGRLQQLDAPDAVAPHARVMARSRCDRRQARAHDRGTRGT